MHFIIELEGAVLDVQPACWAAYCRVAEELSSARVEPATYWRLLRTGADPSEYLRYARPRQLQDYACRFLSHLESEACASLMKPHPEIELQLPRLGRAVDCTLVSGGSNRSVRQSLLNEYDLSNFFARTEALASDRHRWAGQLGQLVETAGRVILVASTVELLRAGIDAQLFTVAAASGSATARRLTQAGAVCTYPDLATLADEIQSGGRKLVALGLPPEPGHYDA